MARGLRQGHSTPILLTGIGRQNAEKSIGEFLSGGANIPASRSQDSGQVRLAGMLALPNLVLTCGFTGGLNPDLKLGDVVFEIPPGSSRGNEAPIKIGNWKSEIENKMEPSHSGCYETLIAAGARPARFFCADRIAVTAAEKKKLREQTGADAVEMESAAIHAVCAERGIPCVTVRVTSDTAGEDLPLDFNRLSKPDQSLDYGKLLLAVAGSPGRVGGLLRLQKNCRLAAERLAEVLVRII